MKIGISYVSSYENWCFLRVFIWKLVFVTCLHMKIGVSYVSSYENWCFLRVCIWKLVFITCLHMKIGVSYVSSYENWCLLRVFIWKLVFLTCLHMKIGVCYEWINKLEFRFGQRHPLWQWQLQFCARAASPLLQADVSLLVGVCLYISPRWPNLCMAYELPHQSSPWTRPTFCTSVFKDSPSRSLVPTLHPLQTHFDWFIHATCDVCVRPIPSAHAHPSPVT